MSYIIYPHTNNELAIVMVTGELPLNDVIARDIPSNISYKVIDTLNIDTHFINAYEYDEVQGAVINIEKAKEIQRNKWRAKRAKLLPTLDIEFQRAQETGRTIDLETVIAKKQALREVTSTYLPDDLESIKNTWPDILNS